MSEVTVVCCWTNEKQYQDFVNTLNAQTIPYELIGIDNRGNKAFTSCAAAYNSVINQVRTKYVIYSHQDILLTEPNMLAKFVAYLERTDCDDIVGVIGVKFDTAGVFSDIMHIQSSTGKLVKVGTHIPDGMMECNTLDECFFGGHSEHFEAFPFNEDICNGWHLYAVEACLKTQSIRNLQDGVWGGGGRFMLAIFLSFIILRTALIMHSTGSYSSCADITQNISQRSELHAQAQARICFMR